MHGDLIAHPHRIAGIRSSGLGAKHGEPYPNDPAYHVAAPQAHGLKQQVKTP